MNQFVIKSARDLPTINSLRGFCVVFDGVFAVVYSSLIAGDTVRFDGFYCDDISMFGFYHVLRDLVAAVI